MFKNYLKIAFRNLLKTKGFSAINIMGLAVGLTACFLIFLYVKFELSYDAFHSKADRIYKIVADVKTPTEVLTSDRPAWAVPPSMKNDFPEVEAAVRLAQDQVLIRKDDIKIQQDDVAWADSSFFTVFDFKLLKGDPKTVLKDQYSAVLSEKAANKYFGKKDPVGQTILIRDDGRTTKVTGLMKDMPENSQFRAEVLISMTTQTQDLARGVDSVWGGYWPLGYVLLKPGADPKALQAKLPAFLERRNGTEMKNSQMFPTLSLEPLRDVYLRSTRNNQKSGNIVNVYIFSVIAVFILLIACINFINLTTARASERAKEVGIRKVVGAEKHQLTKQFIGESIIICLIAFLFSVLFSWLLLPLFNQLAGKTISSGIFDQPSYLITLFAAAIAIGLLAGLYPAFVLSSFRPVVVLKGKFTTGTRGIFLRKALVVSQFTISIALIISTIIVYNQMTFMRNQELGFSKDQVMVVGTNRDKGKDAFKQALTGIPAVKSVSLASAVPGSGNNIAYTQIRNIKGDMQVANLDVYFVDFDYIDQYKIKTVAGRTFSKDFGTDTTQAMVLNEAAVKMFGYSSPDQIIGKKFDQWGREGQVIGVVKDFHFRSLQQPIKPLSMRIEPGNTDFVSIKVSANNLPATIAEVERKWKETIPNRPFSYFFMDEFFDRQYRVEERFGKLFLNFAVLAIFISCLGLLGLASYSTIQRTKEIGIRKVLGASTSNIVNLLSKDFLKLILVSAVIAFPVAWLAMNRWLQDFAYRIGVSWWVFVLAGALATFIALCTISFQAIRAALANPVKTLRTE
ncbi:MAG: ABC transporter permease [Chitinophagaceae bacterium]|nr:ABC transporter permease [Chitinophagaceae bacterium]